jgi:hypothetical protein
MDSDFKNKMNKTSRNSDAFISISIPTKKHSSWQKRLIDSVEGTDDWKRMYECRYEKGAACGSVHCDECRENKQKYMFQSYKKYVYEVFNDEREAREQLRFISILHDVIEVPIDNEYDEKKIISNICQSVLEMKEDLEKVVKKHNTKGKAGIWLAGGVHLELVDYSLFKIASDLGNKTNKQDTLKELIDRHTNNPAGLYFLVHFHALCDRGKLNDAEFRKVFTDRWSQTKRAVHSQRTWEVIKYGKIGKKQTLERSLENTAKYCFNMSNANLTFASNWGTGKIVLKSGEEVDADGHIRGYADAVLDQQIDELLTRGHLRLLVLAHNAVNGTAHRGLVVRMNKTSR